MIETYYKTYPIHRNEEGQYYVWIQNTIYYRDTIDEIKSLIDNQNPSFLGYLLGDK